VIVELLCLGFVQNKTLGDKTVPPVTYDVRFLNLQGDAGMVRWAHARDNPRGNPVRARAQGREMKLIIEVDEALLADARQYTKGMTDDELFSAALRELICHQSSLAALREAFAKVGEIDMSVFVKR
jgi:Bacterial antitoxin of type II TA system, VapB